MADIIVNSTMTMLADSASNMWNTTTAASQVCANQTNEHDLSLIFMPIVLTVSKVMPPIWWCIGILGNVMALLVWLQPKMRHSSGCYLAALAITDAFFLVLSIIFHLHSTYKSAQLLDRAFLCEWFAISYLSVQYMSPVFVLAFTVERYLSVCHPFRMVNVNQSNIKVTVLVILGLALFCVSINGVQGYFWTTKHANSTEAVCNLRQSELLSGNWAIFSTTTEMLIFAAVPLAVLILNILVIVEVRNISHLERRNMRTNSIDRRSTTLMLLGVSFYQIFTVLPVTVMYILYYKFDPSNLDYCLSVEEAAVDPMWVSYFHYKRARLIIENVCTSHYAVNFFIYIMTGKLFRKQLYEMVVIFCCKEKLLYLTAKTGVYTSTRTTRMSLTSQRGSIGRGRLVSLKTSDPCNNDTELGNKNTSSVGSDPETSAMNGSHNTRPVSGGGGGAATRLLPCVEESDTDIHDHDDPGVKL